MRLIPRRPSTQDSKSTVESHVPDYEIHPCTWFPFRPAVCRLHGMPLSASPSPPVPWPVPCALFRLALGFRDCTRSRRRQLPSSGCVPSVYAIAIASARPSALAPASRPGLHADPLLSASARLRGLPLVPSFPRAASPTTRRHALADRRSTPPQAASAQRPCVALAPIVVAPTSPPGTPATPPRARGLRS